MLAGRDRMSMANAGEHRVVWPRHQPWIALALFSFLVHFAWEMLAVSFYAAIATAPHAEAVVACFRTTVGDVGITLTSYAAASVVGTKRWMVRATPRLLAIYLGIGLGATAVLEYISVHVLHRWAYAAVMPTIGGIGLVPLVQWLALPPTILWLARRHLAGAAADFQPTETK